MSSIQFISIGFTAFCFILVNCNNSSNNNITYINEDLREQGIAACCPHPWAECCRQSLRQNDPINCTDLPYQEAFSIGICLEKHFYGKESEMDFRYHNCCWLLNGKECNKKCYHDLRSPTLPPSQKWYFSKLCYTKLNSTVNVTELDCLRDRADVLHSCFRTCLHWQKQHRAKGNAAIAGDRFCPELDCPDYALLMESDECLIPVHLSTASETNCVDELKMKREMAKNSSTLIG